MDAQLWAAIVAWAAASRGTWTDGRIINMASTWRVAKSLLKLRDQVDALYPGRDKSSDGTIGDASHQATKSEHNPDANGVVRAEDISNDPAHGLTSRKLAETLIASRDPRILYIISNREICSSQISPWKWRPYNGQNPHTEHMHISVVESPALYDSEADWHLDATAPPVQPPIVTAPFPSSGKGSWYSQYDGKYPWRDTGDKPNSNALGVDDTAQGISFYRHDALGHWFRVRAPNGVISIEQQTDVGPAPSTGRLIDISAAAAERFGYSPSNFPTDSVFSWEPTDPPLQVVNLPPKEQATAYRDWRRQIQLPPIQPPVKPPTTDPTGDALEARIAEIAASLRALEARQTALEKKMADPTPTTPTVQLPPLDPQVANAISAAVANALNAVIPQIIAAVTPAITKKLSTIDLSGLINKLATGGLFGSIAGGGLLGLLHSLGAIGTVASSPTAGSLWAAIGTALATSLAAKFTASKATS